MVYTHLLTPHVYTTTLTPTPPPHLILSSHPHHPHTSHYPHNSHYPHTSHYLHNPRLYHHPHTHTTPTPHTTPTTHTTLTPHTTPHLTLPSHPHLLQSLGVRLPLLPAFVDTKQWSDGIHPLDQPRPRPQWDHGIVLSHIQLCLVSGKGYIQQVT